MKIGIDPGLNGAVAFIDEEIGIYLIDMPTLDCTWKKPKKDKKGKLKYQKRIDSKKLFSLFKNCPKKIQQINIEIVHSMPKQGIVSTFTFGGAFYAALAATEISTGLTPNMILPQTWKRYYGLIGHDKDMARKLALKMFPSLETRLKRKKDVDRADALLIGLMDFV